MRKDQIELCREVIKILDKSEFKISAPEMIQVSLKLLSFGKMVQEAEKALVQATPTVEQITTPPLQTKRRR